MANSFDTADLDVFLGDFSVSVTATTWDTTVTGIFDTQYVEFEDMSRESPTLLVKTSDVPSTATTGDLFVIDSTTYKLIDKEYYDPGMTRLVLAKTS